MILCNTVSPNVWELETTAQPISATCHSSLAPTSATDTLYLLRIRSFSEPTARRFSLSEPTPGRSITKCNNETTMEGMTSSIPGLRGAAAPAR